MMVMKDFYSATITSSGPEDGALFHFDEADGSTTPVDSSGNGHTMTLTSADVDTAQSVFGGSSLHILSSGSLYELDGSSDFAFGTGDFTIEFRVLLSSTSGTRVLYFSGAAYTTAGAYPGIRNVSGTGLLYTVGNTAVITGTGLVFNTWYHIAVTRASGVTRMFVDGVQQGSDYADSNNYIIGTSRPSCTAFNGWIEELHVVKGRAQWTANFTPPAAPWVGYYEIEDATDAWEAAVVTNGGSVSGGRKTLVQTMIASLMNNGVWHKLDRLWVGAAENEESAFIDLKALSDTCTNVNSTVFVPDTGHWSSTASWIALGFTPSTDARLYKQNSAHAATWNLTAETRAAGSYVVSGYGTLSIYPRYNDGNIYVRVGDSSSAGTQLPHDALSSGFIYGSRNSTAKDIYHRGRRLAVWGSTTAEAVASAELQYYDRHNAISTIGAWLTEAEQEAMHAAFYDYIYAVTIRPPTFAAPTLLLHFNGADASTTFTDSSPTGLTVTPVNSAAIDTAQSKWGGSSFGPDGTSYLSVTPTSDLAFGTGDFTVDFWVYATADGTNYQYLFDPRPASTNGAYLTILLQNYYFQVYVNGVVRIYSQGWGGASKWTHIAVTRASGVTRLFRNGRCESSAWADTTNYVVGNPTIAGSVVVGTSNGDSLNGWMEEFRVVKGTAVWTKNFFVPRSPYDNTYAHPFDRWKAAVVAAGGSVSGGRETLLRAFIDGCLEDGVWHLIERLWILAAENTQSALIDLVALTAATPTNSPTFTTDRGYAGNGINSYLDTNFNPYTDMAGAGAGYHEAGSYNGYKAHFGLWCNTSRSAAFAGTAGSAGCFVWPNEVSINPFTRDDGNTYDGMYFWMQACRGIEAFHSTPTASSLGWFMTTVKPEGALAQTAYHNGIRMDRQPISYGYFNPPNGNLYICGTANVGLTTDQCSAMSYGDDMDDVQAKKYYARLRTLMTAVGVT